MDKPITSAIKKLGEKLTGKSSQANSISDAIDDITKNYGGVEVDNDSIVLNDGGKIALNVEYAKYLRRNTYEAPKLDLGTSTDENGVMYNKVYIEDGREVGRYDYIDWGGKLSFNLYHIETNVNDIVGKITLTHNISTKSQVEPFDPTTEPATECFSLFPGVQVFEPVNFVAQYTDKFGDVHERQFRFLMDYHSYVRGSNLTYISDLTDEEKTELLAGTFYHDYDFNGTVGVDLTEEQYVYFITTKEIRTAKVDGVVIEFGGVARMTFNKTGDDGNTYSHAYWAHRTKDKYAAGHHVFELTFS